MRRRTLDILKRLKRSRTTPKIGALHIGELVADVEELGQTRFAAEAIEVLKPSRKRKGRTPSHPLTEFFLSAQDRTRFRTRAQFIKAVIDEAKSRYGSRADLPSSARSMPRLLERYSIFIPRETLKDILQRVGERYRHSL